MTAGFAVSAGAVEADEHDGRPGPRHLEVTAIVDTIPSEAYAAWASGEALSSWMAPVVEMEPEVNGHFRVQFSQPGTDYVGTDDLHMLSLEPPSRVMFTWDAPVDFPHARSQRTVVEVRFESVSDTQTRVTLWQYGWGEGEEWDATFAYFETAWTYVLGAMERHFEAGHAE